MQGDLGFFTAVLSIAQSQEWATVFKLGALVVIGEKALKLTTLARRVRREKANGGSDGDKLYRIEEKLTTQTGQLSTLIGETRDMRHEMRESAIRQADALERIAAEARHNNETQAGLLTVIRQLAEIQARRG